MCFNEVVHCIAFLWCVVCVVNMCFCVLTVCVLRVCCTDDSGRWGRGGLFTALEMRSDEPSKQYELAGSMKGRLVLINHRALRVSHIGCETHAFHPIHTPHFVFLTPRNDQDDAHQVEPIDIVLEHWNR